MQQIRRSFLRALWRAMELTTADPGRIAHPKGLPYAILWQADFKAKIVKNLSALTKF